MSKGREEGQSRSQEGGEKCVNSTKKVKIRQMFDNVDKKRNNFREKTLHMTIGCDKLCIAIQTADAAGRI